MAKQVQRRGGTSSDHEAFTGADREWTHDDTLKAIRVHDGSQAGGFPIFHEGYVESAPDGGTDAFSADARRPVSAGETVRADFTSANTTTTPTFENTQGTPSGALTITTRYGSALWAGALSGVHELQLNAGGTAWLALDPNDETVAQTNTLTTMQALPAGVYRTVYMRGRATAGDGGGGHFRWDSSDLSTEVGNDEVTAGEGDGGIYVAPDSDKTGASGAWVRLLDVPVNLESYGLSNDADAAFAAFIAGGNTTGWIPYGIYTLTSPISWTLSDCSLVAPPGTVIQGDLIKVLEFTANCSNCRFEGITFKSTKNDATTHFSGVIQSNNVALTEVYFVRCSFSAPNTEINAAKHIAEDTDFIDGLYYVDCFVDSVGKMGYEFQNHVDDGTKRFQNCHIRGGVIRDTGLSGASGQGVSYSGDSDGCTVTDVTFDNVGLCVELVGVDSAQVLHNRFRNGCGKPFSVTDGGQGRTNSNPIIANNITEELLTDGFNLYSISGGLFSNNILVHLGTGSAPKVRADRMKIHHNIIRANAGDYVITQDDGEECEYLENEFDLSNSSAGVAAVSFQGTASRNRLRGGIIKSGSTGTWTEDTSTTNNNYALRYLSGSNRMLGNNVVHNFPSDANDVLPTEKGEFDTIVITDTGGNLTQNRTLTFPEHEKHWVVVNNTSVGITLAPGSDTIASGSQRLAAYISGLIQIV